MTEIAPFSEEKSCPRLCQVHLYREKLTIEVKVLILPFGIFLFSKNVEKAKIANQRRMQTFWYRAVILVPEIKGGGGTVSFSFSLYPAVCHRYCDAIDCLKDKCRSKTTDNFSSLRLGLLGWDNDTWVPGISCKNIAQGYTVPTPGQNQLIPVPVTCCLQLLLAIWCNNSENKNQERKDSFQRHKTQFANECLITSVKSKQMNMTVIHFQSYETEPYCKAISYLSWLMP